MSHSNCGCNPSVLYWINPAPLRLCERRRLPQMYVREFGYTPRLPPRPRSHLSTMLRRAQR